MTKKKSSSSASARRLLLAEELEGIENKIMETGLLSDLVPIGGFDVQLQIFGCGKTTAKIDAEYPRGPATSPLF
jgi:hypothetical protein